MIFYSVPHFANIRHSSWPIHLFCRMSIIVLSHRTHDLLTDTPCVIPLMSISYGISREQDATKEKLLNSILLLVMAPTVAIGLEFGYPKLSLQIGAKYASILHSRLHLTSSLSYHQTLIFGIWRTHILVLEDVRYLRVSYFYFSSFKRKERIYTVTILDLLCFIIFAEVGQICMHWLCKNYRDGQTCSLLRKQLHKTKKWLLFVGWVIVRK